MHGRREARRRAAFKGQGKAVREREVRMCRRQVAESLSERLEDQALTCQPKGAACVVLHTRHDTLGAAAACVARCLDGAVVVPDAEPPARRFAAVKAGQTQAGKRPALLWHKKRKATQ